MHKLGVYTGGGTRFEGLASAVGTIWSTYCNYLALESNWRLKTGSEVIVIGATCTRSPSQCRVHTPNARARDYAYRGYVAPKRPLRILNHKYNTLRCINESIKEFQGWICNRACQSLWWSINTQFGMQVVHYDHPSMGIWKKNKGLVGSMWSLSLKAEDIAWKEVQPTSTLCRFGKRFVTGIPVALMVSHS